MLMMRLQRIGRRNEPHFKIVVIEKSKGPKSQKYIDVVGTYNPKAGDITIDVDVAKKWIANGVQPSDTVYNMLVEKNIMEGRKKNVLPHKSPVVDEEKIAREKEAAEAKAAKEKEEQEAATAETESEESEKTEETNEELAEETESNDKDEADLAPEAPSADELEAAQEGAPEEVTKETDA